MDYNCSPPKPFPNSRGQHHRLERGRRDAVHNLVYPPTPRSLSKALPPLPDNKDDQHHVLAELQGEQLLPDFLLFHNEALPSVDPRISFQERKRPVAQPTITFMPEYPDYLWGAVNGHVTSRDDGLRVHFQDITEVATNPAVSTMRITTGPGEGATWLEVQPQEDATYITVADVQRSVIGWLKEVPFMVPHKGKKPSFSSWVRLADHDGEEVEVEVWTWKGLKPLDDTLERWELQYADDE